MSVIETPFGFLEVGKEGNGAIAAKSGQTGFGVAPERLDAIDVAAPHGEFIGAVMNPDNVCSLREPSRRIRAIHR